MERFAEAFAFLMRTANTIPQSGNNKVLFGSQLLDALSIFINAYRCNKLSLLALFLKQLSRT
jgi:hypothetical protein